MVIGVDNVMDDDGTDAVAIVVAGLIVVDGTPMVTVSYRAPLIDDDD